MIERLEARISPAGIVNVTHIGGIAVIKGDSAGNQIQLSSGGPGITLITGMDGETLRLNGAVSAGPIELTNLTKTLFFELGAGDDQLRLVDANIPVGVSVVPGDGADDLFFTDTTIAGNLTITASPGSDDIIFNGSVFRLGGSLTFNDPLDSNTLFLNSDTSVIQGGIKLTSGTVISQFQLGSGDSALRVGGSVSIKAPAKADGGLFELLGASVAIGGDLSIDRPATITQSSDRLNADEIRIGGKLKLNYGTGGHEFLVGSDGTDLLSIGGILEVSKSGENSANFDIRPDVFEVHGIKAKLSDRNHELTIATLPGGVSILGAVKVAGTGDLTIAGGGTIAGATKIAGSEVNLQGDINAPLFIASSLAVQLTTNSISTGGIVRMTLADVFGGVSLQGSASHDLVQIDESTFTGAFSTALDLGDDELKIETILALTGNSRFFGPFKARFGPGDDIALISTAAATTTTIFQSSVLLDGGPGLNDITTTGSFFPAGQPIEK